MNFTTKQAYQESLIQLCEPLKKYFSEGKAHIRYGCTAAHYDAHTTGLESFSRLLWGLVPFFAGGGSEQELEKMYKQGLGIGADPDHPEYWGKMSMCHQGFVEMAAIGLGLLLTPDKLWAPLSDREKTNLNTWLLQINEHVIPSNNWLFFRVLVNVGLKKVGANYSQDAIDESLETIEGFYLGDGWYSDGKSSQRDYYIAFAMHFYGLIYAKTMKDDDAKRSDLYIERAKLFAKDFIYWFVESGDALPFGRSLTYRFGQCAFWSALAFADVEVYSWGVMKGIINRHLNAWFDKPILDAEGKLTIGYAYPNIQMAEAYNSPGSPYWAFKSLLVLALPDDHPFWMAEEEEMPCLEAISIQPHAKMVLQRLSPKHSVALTSGQYAGWEPLHTAEKYSKFAYSTYFGFNVPKSYYSFGQAAPDNMLAFERDHMYFVRRKCDVVELRGKGIYSKWSPMTGIVVETILEPMGKGHMRKHTIHSEISCKAMESGFALPNAGDGKLKVERGEQEILIHTEKAYSRIVLKSGKGEFEQTQCETSTNILYPKVNLPYIKLEIEPGTTEIEVYVEGDLLEE